MIDRTTKLRWRRRYRHKKRQVEDIGSQAEDNLEKLFFRRLGRLADVRRFIISWLLLLVLLISGVVFQTQSLSSLYQESQPVPGGTFTEGIIGTFTNANPLYATGSVDSSVSKLVFSGLMRYDQHNRLTQDLAASIDVDATGSKYTVKLRDDIFWHDGKRVTADDVLFTYRTIQNPDAKSPLLTSWQGITIEKANAHTVVFTLSNALTSFPHSLTNGIVPKHLLEGVPAAQLRSIRFNTVSPVGSGPFKWETIEVKGNDPDEREEQVGLLPNERYHRGAPKLQHFIIRTFRDETKMLESLSRQELNAVAGLESVPDNLEIDNLREYNVPLTGEVAVFFKTTLEPLTDVKVRQALVQSIDQISIINGLGYPVVAARGPLLDSQLGYNEDILQLPLNVTAANQLLDNAGWVRGPDGIRTKDGRALSFRLFSQTTSEYAYVTRELQRQWREIGVNVEVTLQSASDLQSTITRHDYDVLLYGISLGIDPDVFAYWHSSQATSRSGSWLNFSEYQSATADKSLESGRTRSDAALRAVKYRPFLEAWRNDAPAMALYQPRFLYITRSPIANFEPKTINIATDRYANVINWMIREGKAIKQPTP